MATSRVEALRRLHNAPFGRGPHHSFHVERSYKARASPPSANLELSLVDSISSIGEEAWTGCASGADHPLISYSFLSSMEESLSASIGSGWAPQHVRVQCDGVTVAVVPLYLKGHSYGEFVFDQQFAEVWQLNKENLSNTGKNYYPKLLSGVPFTPVTTSKLLVNEARLDSLGMEKAQLLTAVADTMRTLPNRMGVSSIHVNFQGEEENRLLRERGFVSRKGIQYHWSNAGYGSFDEFLRDLKQSKRKMIRAERRRVQERVNIRLLTGDDVRYQPHVWDSFFEFYLSTVDKRWGQAYLTREFFDLVSERMADQILLVAAFDHPSDNTPIAAALNFVGDDALYGRNWGCRPGVEINALHFELCYYQAIEYAIDRGLSTVEAGAQGEETKVARGYRPTFTYSSHFFDDPDLSGAIDSFCRREAQAISRHAEDLDVLVSPYK
jgi:predicted N-acyltransferase